MERRSKPTDHGCGSLPTFLIVGERRCGTTSLAKWMEDHPDIFMHPKPDMAFFVDDEIVGRREWLDGEIDESTWGRTHSKESYAALFAEGTDRAAIGEKSADYLFWRPSHARIARFLPTAKVIVTLRHPVERAWSHYWNEVGKGRETLSFEEALEQEDDRSRRSAYARNHLSYRTRGYYDESLTDLFAHIPRDRTMVVTLEEAQQRPAELLRQIYTFIGVDAEQGLNRAGVQFNRNWTVLPTGWSKFPILGTLERLSTSLLRKSIRKLVRDPQRSQDIFVRAISLFRTTKENLVMPAKTRRQLDEQFQPHIEKLAELVGREFPEWS